MDVTNALHVYLNDHRAGSMMGVELARTLRSRFEGTPRGPFFAELAADIEADRATLDALMASLQVTGNVLKQAGGWTAEKLSRLKLNRWFTGSPPLTVLLEIEALSLGVEGKLALWRSLKVIEATSPVLAAAPLDELIERAQRQRDGLERERISEATSVLEAA